MLLITGTALLLTCVFPELVLTVFVPLIPVMVGWLALPLRTIPRMRWEPMMLASAVVYAVAFVGGLHVLMWSFTGRRRWRLTLRIAAVPLLMFVAGTSVVAMVAAFEGLAVEPVFIERGSGREPASERKGRDFLAVSEDSHYVVVRRPDGSVGAIANFPREPARRNFVNVGTGGGSRSVTFDEFQRIRRDLEAGKLLEPGKGTLP